MSNSGSYLQSPSLAFSIPDDVVPKIYGRNGGTLPTARRSPSPIQTAADKHATELAKRMLRSWVRVIAECTGAGQHLPPFIHPAQCHRGLAESLPETLSNCCKLATHWLNSRLDDLSVMREVIIREAKMLAGRRDIYTSADLLAASQSLVILVSILLFGPATPKATDQAATTDTPDLNDDVEQSQLILELWEMRECLMRSLHSSQQLQLDPASLSSSSWRSWATSAATTRTILAMHTLELVWGTIRGYPIMSCFGLDKLPMPEAGYLWRARSKEDWMSLYAAWSRRWSALPRSLSAADANEGGLSPYTIGDFLAIRSGDLDERAEVWLSEADEFGVMFMAGGKYIFSRAAQPSLLLSRRQVGMLTLPIQRDRDVQLGIQPLAQSPRHQPRKTYFRASMKVNIYSSS